MTAGSEVRAMCLCAELATRDCWADWACRARGMQSQEHRKVVKVPGTRTRGGRARVMHSTLNLHRRHLIELALFGSGCYAPP